MITGQPRPPGITPAIIITPSAASNRDSTSSSQRQASASGGTQGRSHFMYRTWDMSGLKKRKVVELSGPAQDKIAVPLACH
jgi:hypothetical protein